MSQFSPLSRRHVASLLGGAALMASLPFSVGHAEDKVVKVGINLSLTGADASAALRAKNGAVMAAEEINAKGGVNGYKIEVVTFDDGSATAGQYDPAQAATNARRMVSDAGIVAAVGPQMSGAGKAMAPILSAGNLATITPSSTNPDITDPKFAAQFRPSGKPIYFRTVTTDAFQGPNMANYIAGELKAPTVYILDDSGAYGVGMADAFERQANLRGMKVLGRDRLDPKAADYAAILTKIKSLAPAALYYGGVSQAGVKLVKQVYEILPHDMIRAGGDGLYGPEILTGSGFPAADGWYATIAAPNVTADPKVASWIKAYTTKYGIPPDNYSVTANSAMLVIIDAVKRASDGGQAPTRDRVRDMIQSSNVPTLQGEVSFDANGDLKDRTVSIFQVRQDKSAEPGDMSKQFHYVGVAPMS